MAALTRKEYLIQLKYHLCISDKNAIQCQMIVEMMRLRAAQRIILDADRKSWIKIAEEIVYRKSAIRKLKMKIAFFK
jgi:hypothetical protein